MSMKQIMFVNELEEELSFYQKPYKKDILRVVAYVHENADDDDSPLNPYSFDLTKEEAKNLRDWLNKFIAEQEIGYV